MKFEEYQFFKKDSIFLSKLAYVCENCFLELTKYCYILGSNLVNYMKTVNPKVKGVKSKYLKMPEINNRNEESKEQNIFSFKSKIETAQLVRKLNKNMTKSLKQMKSLDEKLKSENENKSVEKKKEKQYGETYRESRQKDNKFGNTNLPLI